MENLEKSGTYQYLIEVGYTHLEILEYFDRIELYDLHNNIQLEDDFDFDKLPNY